MTIGGVLLGPWVHYYYCCCCRSVRALEGTVQACIHPFDKGGHWWRHTFSWHVSL